MALNIINNNIVVYVNIRIKTIGFVFKGGGVVVWVGASRPNYYIPHLSSLPPVPR